MPRLTFDAISIQAVIGPNEHLPMHTIAMRAFCPEAEKADRVSLLRARRGCQILAERGIVTIAEGIGDGCVVSSAFVDGYAAPQLQAVMARAIITTGTPTEEFSGEDEES
jgi:hypothetical protein